MTALQSDIAAMASLIGDKVRSQILIALLDNKALTAGELALQANISAQTTSNHLKKLQQAKLIICEPVGRHRYYKLASNKVAQALESLGVLSQYTLTQAIPRHEKLDKDICFARTCYDHLAGELAVQLKNALIRKKMIRIADNQFLVTTKGNDFFKNMNIDVDTLRQQRRQFARSCLDWTQREHHIAGSLGTAILQYLLENRLIIKSKNKARVITVTTKGYLWLKENLDIES